MCEAFQITAAERAEQVALRTIGEAVTITYGDYAERIRRLAAGLHRLGVRRADTVGLMLTNRPEFHLLDTAAMHLGATPFSIYNTSSAEQIAYLLERRRQPRDGGRGPVPRPRTRSAMNRPGSVDHLIVLDARPAGRALARRARGRRARARTSTSRRRGAPSTPTTS